MTASSWCNLGCPSFPEPPVDHLSARETNATLSGEFGSIMLNSLTSCSAENTRVLHVTEHRPCRNVAGFPHTPFTNRVSDTAEFKPSIVPQSNISTCSFTPSVKLNPLSTGLQTAQLDTVVHHLPSTSSSTSASDFSKASRTSMDRSAALFCCRRHKRQDVRSEIYDLRY